MDAQVGYVVAGAGSAAVAGWWLAGAAMEKRGALLRRREARRLGGVSKGAGELFLSQGVCAWVLAYMVALEQRLAHGSTRALSKALPRPSAAARDAFDLRLCHAGFTGEVSMDTSREARVRLACLAGGVGLLVGACLSNELAALLAICGAVAGARAPAWALDAEARERAVSCMRELPELLEVVSLGLRSGLTFDRSFGLYHAHFDTRFARECSVAQRSWSAGFSTREGALRELAAAYDSDLLQRVVENVVRSLRYGTSLAADLEKAAADSHDEQKAARLEQVVKTPIKMMVPTATLILPAMLLLVLGPVLLELMGGM